MRSAEKARKSTCPFADDVAALTIAHFRRLCPEDVQEQYKTNQTVLASFVVQWKDSKELELLSLATGTKVLSENILQENRRHLEEALQHGDTVLRDMHAEILARRGMIRHFLELIFVAKPLLDNHFLDCEKSTNDGLDLSENREVKRFRPNNDGYKTISTIPHSSNILVDSSVTSCDDDGDKYQRQLQHKAYARLQQFFEIIPDENRKWSLQWRNEQVRLHLYTSSAPCGNACLKHFAPKKKAKAKNTKSHLDSTEHNETEFEYSGSESFPIAEPLMPGHKAPNSVSRPWIQYHENVQFTHVAEGQVALTVKVNTPTDIGKETVHDSEPLVENKEVLSSALCSVFAGKGRSLSCSDKILRWNCTGVQGGVLGAFLASNSGVNITHVDERDGRMLLSSIIIGRKYSEHHATRALCCRASAWCLPCVVPLPTNTNNDATNNTISSASITDKSSHISDSISNSGSVADNRTLDSNERRDERFQFVDKNKGNSVKIKVHHPAILCTAVKLQEGGISATQGAQFNESRVFVACQSLCPDIFFNGKDESKASVIKSDTIGRSDYHDTGNSGFIWEIVDSKSGKLENPQGSGQDTGVSRFSSASIATLAERCLFVGDTTHVSHRSYPEWKRQLCPHCVADVSSSLSRHNHVCYRVAKDHLQRTLKHVFVVSYVSPPLSGSCTNNITADNHDDENNTSTCINNNTDTTETNNCSRKNNTTTNKATVSCWPLYKPV